MEARGLSSRGADHGTERLGVCHVKDRKRLEKAEGRGRTVCEGTKVRERVTSLGTHTGPVMPVHEGFEGVEK